VSGADSRAIGARGDQAREGHQRREIGQRETEHGRAAGDEGALHVGDIGGDFIGVEARGGDIVGAAENGREIGLQRERGVELPRAHLGCGEPAHGEVGVEESTLLGGDALGEPLRPTAIAADFVRIVDALGRAVAESDVARETDER
jgi:hypothetical protein